MITTALHGDKLYQERARRALPLLIAQATIKEPITYQDLANELGVHHRQLNYPLGYIGESITQLNEELGIDIPYIQCIAVSKETREPGGGLDVFLKELKDTKLTKIKRRDIIEKAQDKVYQFKQWATVLKKLRLEPTQSDFSALNKKAISSKPKSGRGGEGELHKKLKNYVKNNPDEFGRIKPSVKKTEHSLPSGDSLDVYFKQGKKWIGVEVKSEISSYDDILRGMYQCIKYKAVLEAQQKTEGLPINTRVFLVIEKPLTTELHRIKNILQIEVYIKDKSKIKLA